MPSLAASRPKPQVSGNVSLRNILGTTTGPVVSAWQPNTAMGDGNGQVEDQGEAGEGPVSGDTKAASQTKGKKGKGKQKQTLFTMGSFPT